MLSCSQANVVFIVKYVSSGGFVVMLHHQYQTYIDNPLKKLTQVKYLGMTQFI